MNVHGSGRVWFTNAIFVFQANANTISNIAYHDVAGQKAEQEKKRSLVGEAGGQPPSLGENEYFIEVDKNPVNLEVNCTTRACKIQVTSRELADKKVQIGFVLTRS